MSLGIGIGLAITRGQGASPLSNPIIDFFEDGTVGLDVGGNGAWYFQDTIGATPAVDDNTAIARVSDRTTTGNNALQTSSGNRPKLFTVDGFQLMRAAASHLRTTLTPGVEMTVLMKLKLAADAVSGYLLGTFITGNRFRLHHTNGILDGAVGNNVETTIKGSVDRRGSIGVLGLTYDGATVRLFWNGGVEYQGAQSGDPSAITSSPIYLMASNTATGVQSTPVSGDYYRFILAQKAASPEEMLDLSNFILTDKSTGADVIEGAGLNMWGDESGVLSLWGDGSGPLQLWGDGVTA